MTPRRGEIWWADSLDKRRPVLVITRSAAVPVLDVITIVPVTRTVRGIPTELRLGPVEGLRRECVAAFDAIQPIRRSFLTERVGALALDRLDEVCFALEQLADC